MITGALCRAARALVEIDRKALSDASGVAEDAIAAFERGIQDPDAAAIAALQAALETYGALFLPEERARGAGVRLKFSRNVSARLQGLENEGGISASDDVP